jgi:hypothetical protein
MAKMLPVGPDFMLVAFFLAAAVSLDPPSPPATGGFPDSLEECQPAANQPQWPTFHLFDNVTRLRDGQIGVASLNDMNAIFFYRGIYHIMNQDGGGNWTNSISNDLVHWYHTQNVLGYGPSRSTWDVGGACDGQLSFPDLGKPPFNGSTPIIMYGPACRKPVPPTPPLVPTPPPAPTPCHIHVHHTVGCFNISDWKPASPPPVLPSYQPSVHGKLTLESCASACYKAKLTLAGVEGGSDCFCGAASDLSTPAAKARSLPDKAVCEAIPCDGDGAEKGCGGKGAMLAYQFTCDNGASGALGSGDAPRMEVVLPVDPEHSDPYLSRWVKTQPGPVKFDGIPCSFPGRVWKSKNGNYWNQLCAVNGLNPWARYTSSDPSLMSWKQADTDFVVGVNKSEFISYGAALFHKIPGSETGGPTHMINANSGSEFYVGTYDSKTELMTVNLSAYPRQVLSSGNYWWAAAGPNGPVSL